MKILIVTSPPAKHLRLSYHEKRIHLGVLYLIAALEREKHEVNLCDLYLTEENLPKIEKYDFVGIHCTTITFRSTMDILKRLYQYRKMKDWHGKIIVGGPHASLMPDSFPDFVDHIVQGEGEYALKDIVNGINTDSLLHYERIKDLDKLPRPAYHHYKFLPYTKWDVDMLGVEPIATMNTSRGCPFSCTFCSVGSIWGKTYTYHSAQRIVDDILYLKREYGTKGIFFREDNFTINNGRIYELCSLLQKKNLRIKWMCETRADSLSEELLKAMHASGCRCIYIGAEAGTQRMLDILDKRITINQVKQAAKWCHKIGIKIHASFITNLPGENIEDKIAIFKLLNEIKPHSYEINKYRGYPGSRIYESLVKKGLYKKISPEGLLDTQQW